MDEVRAHGCLPPCNHASTHDFDPTPCSSCLQVLSIYALVRDNFPHAEVKAAGFDAFVEDLMAASGDGNSLHLPVVTGARGGGGWGSASVRVGGGRKEGLGAAFGPV